MNYFQFVLLGISFLSIYSALFYTLYFFLNQEQLKEKAKIKSNKTVSIIASVWNEEKNIERWIKSNLAQTYPVKIYIVNDLSTDKTHSICKKYADKGLINYFVNKENKGKVVNQNFLLKNHVKTDLFCVLDADCFYEKDTVEKLVKNFNDKNVGAAIPTTKVYGAKNFLERVQMVEYYLSSFIRPISGLFNGIYTTNGLTMFKTKKVKEVGYFDEDNLTEDMDMCMKLYAAGYKIIGDKSPHASTLPVKKLNHYIKQRRRWQTGFLDNVFNHRKTIKSQPGMMYVTFPFAFAWIGIITGLFIRLVYNITDSLIKWWASMKLIDFDIVFYLRTILDNPLIFRANIVSTTMLIASLVFFTLLVFSISRIENNNRFKLALSVPLYMISYSILLTITWFASYSYILKNRGRRVAWTHQT